MTAWRAVNLLSVSEGDAVRVFGVRHRVAAVSRQNMLGVSWVVLRLEPPSDVDRIVYPAAYSGHCESLIEKEFNE